VTIYKIILRLPVPEDGSTESPQNTDSNPRRLEFYGKI
jgi:hypothetical protein